MTKEQKERKNWHPSQRGWFQECLYQEMQKNKYIHLLCGDLGYKIFDKHIKDFPDRAFSVGASEQAMLDMACGMAYSGKIPIVYSITTFLIFRGYETIRTYIEHEQIPVKLIGSGQDFDYEHDGWSHHCPDIYKLMVHFPHIKSYYPQKKEDIPDLVKKMIKVNEPYFINLRRGV